MHHVLAEGVNAFHEYIQNETLTVEMGPRPVPAGLLQVSDSFDSETLTIGLERVDA